MIIGVVVFVLYYVEAKTTQLPEKCENTKLSKFNGEIDYFPSPDPRQITRNCEWTFEKPPEQEFILVLEIDFLKSYQSNDEIKLPDGLPLPIRTVYQNNESLCLTYSLPETAYYNCVQQLSKSHCPKAQAKVVKLPIQLSIQSVANKDQNAHHHVNFHLAYTYYFCNEKDAVGQDLRNARGKAANPRGISTPSQSRGSTFTTIFLSLVLGVCIVAIAGLVYIIVHGRRGSRKTEDDDRKYKKKKRRDKRRKKRRRSRSSEETTSIPIPKVAQVYRAEFDPGSDRGDQGSITSEYSQRKSKSFSEGQFDDVSMDEESIDLTRESGEGRRSRGRKLDVFWYSTDDDGTTTVDDDASVTTQESIPSSYGGGSSKRVRFKQGSPVQTRSDQSLSEGFTQSYEPSPSSSLKRSFDEDVYQPESPQIILNAGESLLQKEPHSIVVRGSNPVIEMRPKPQNQMEVRYVPATEQNFQAAKREPVTVTYASPYVHETMTATLEKPMPMMTAQRPSNVAPTPVLVNDNEISWLQMVRNSPDVTVYDVSDTNRTVKTGYLSSSRSSSRASNYLPAIAAVPFSENQNITHEIDGGTIAKLRESRATTAVALPPYSPTGENFASSNAIQSSMISSPTFAVPGTFLYSNVNPERNLQLISNQTYEQQAPNTVFVTAPPQTIQSSPNILYNENLTQQQQQQQLVSSPNILVRSAPPVKRSQSPNVSTAYDAKIFSPHPQVLMAPPQSNIAHINPQLEKTTAAQFAGPVTPLLVKPIPLRANTTMMQTFSPGTSNIITPTMTQQLDRSAGSTLASPTMSQFASPTMLNQPINTTMTQPASPQITQPGIPTVTQLPAQGLTHYTKPIQPIGVLATNQIGTPIVTVQGQPDQLWYRNISAISNVQGGQSFGNQPYSNYATNQQLKMPGMALSGYLGNPEERATTWLATLFMATFAFLLQSLKDPSSTSSKHKSNLLQTIQKSSDLNNGKSAMKSILAQSSQTQPGRISHLIDPSILLGYTGQSAATNGATGMVDDGISDQTTATSVTNFDDTSGYTTSQSDYTTASGRTSQSSLRSSATSLRTSSASRFSETDGETTASTAVSPSATDTQATDLTSMDEEIDSRRSRRSKTKKRKSRRRQSTRDSNIAFEQDDDTVQEIQSAKDFLKSKHSRSGAIVASEHSVEALEIGDEQAANLEEENVDDDSHSVKKKKHIKSFGSSAAIDQTEQDVDGTLTQEPEGRKSKRRSRKSRGKSSATVLDDDVTEQDVDGSSKQEIEGRKSKRRSKKSRSKSSATALDDDDIQKYSKSFDSSTAIDQTEQNVDSTSTQEIEGRKSKKRSRKSRSKSSATVLDDDAIQKQSKSFGSSTAIDQIELNVDGTSETEGRKSKKRSRKSRSKSSATVLDDDAIQKQSKSFGSSSAIDQIEQNVDGTSETEGRKSKKRSRKSRSKSSATVLDDGVIQQAEDEEFSKVTSQPDINFAVENALSKVESLLASRLRQQLSSVVNANIESQKDEQLERSSENRKSRKKSKTKLRSSEALNREDAEEEDLAKEDDAETETSDKKKRKSRKRSKSVASQQEANENAQIQNRETLTKLLSNLYRQQTPTEPEVDDNAGEVVAEGSIDSVDAAKKQRKSKKKKTSTASSVEAPDETAVGEEEQAGNDEKRKSRRKSKRKSKKVDEPNEYEADASQPENQDTTTSTSHVQRASGIQSSNLLDRKEKEEVTRRTTFPEVSPSQKSNASIQNRSTSLYDNTMTSSDKLSIAKLIEDSNKQKEEN